MDQSELALEKYSAYKDSGVEWLGEIPAHWATVKMKYLFRDVSIKNRQDETLLSVTQSQGVVPRDWVETRMVMPSGNLESFKFIQKGDFAISLRSFEGGLEYCHHDGIISPAYTVLKINRNLVDFYYKHLFKSFAFISEIQTSVIGIREGKNISYPELSYSLIPVPPLAEQTAIATFLDEKTAQIDTAIAQKEKLIALLEERKQIIIQTTVTKGLDPTAPMKDSGVEWLGEIPAHWEVVSVKHVLSMPITDGPHTTPALLDQGIPFISAESIKNGEIDFSKKRGFISRKDHELFCQKYSPKRGDIYMVKSGATTGNIAMVKTDVEFSIWSPLAVFRANSSILSRDYLYRFLESSSFRKGVELKWSYGTQQNIGMGVLSNLPIIFGSLEEQHAIVAHIESESAKTEQAIRLQQAQIEKLKEYKTILINNAVTGKINVL